MTWHWVTEKLGDLALGLLPAKLTKCLTGFNFLNPINMQQHCCVRMSVLRQSRFDMSPSLVLCKVLAINDFLHNRFNLIDPLVLAHDSILSCVAEPGAPRLYPIQAVIFHYTMVHIKAS